MPNISLVCLIKIQTPQFDYHFGGTISGWIKYEPTYRENEPSVIIISSILLSALQTFILEMFHIRY